MTMHARAFKKGFIIALVAAGLVIGAIALMPSSKRHVSTKPTPKALLVAAGSDFPTPSSRVPAGLISAYDAAKNRTTMTLTLEAVAAACDQASMGVSTVTIAFISEFDGKSRDPNDPERSVKCMIKATGREQGFFAVSAPPATFTAGTLSFDAREPAKGVSVYHTKRELSGVAERVSVRLRTEDLVKAVHAGKLAAKVGVVRATLSPSQVDDLKEFVARLQ